MIEVNQSITIRSPLVDVFDYVSDMSNNPHWQSGMKSCVWTSEPPLRIGSTFEQHAEFLGRDMFSSFEVTAFEPNALIRASSTSGPMPIEVSRSVFVTPDGDTTVEAMITGDPTGLFRIGEPLLRRLVARNVLQDYRRLKQVLEGNS